jgi:hypothetical protein
MGHQWQGDAYILDFIKSGATLEAKYVCSDY